MTTKAGSTVHGPDFIALQVSDLESSKQFWVEKVGLVPVPEIAPRGGRVRHSQPSLCDHHTKDRSQGFEPEARLGSCALDAHRQRRGSTAPGYGSTTSEFFRSQRMATSAASFPSPIPMATRSLHMTGDE